MKHTVQITLILLALFFSAQALGLFTVSKYIEVEVGEDGNITILHGPTVVGEQPEMTQEEKSNTYIMITVMVLVGTALLFILIRFKLGNIWKLWFLFAIAMTLSISFDVYINKWIAIAAGLGLALWRTLKPNPVLHNFTEVFIYTGITILILPLLNLFSASLLLVVISLYDMFAVWKSKHMITLAKFQIDSKSFAGFSMDYKKSEEKPLGIKTLSKVSKNGSVSKRSKKTTEPPIIEKKPSNAILGGGDIAFPLLFSAAVMEHIILKGIPKIHAVYYSFAISVGAGIALALLLFLAKKDRFYPAMPFISAGCFAGYGIILLLL